MASIFDLFRGRGQTGSASMQFYGGDLNNSGEVISAVDALKNPTVLSCVNIIKENIAQLDCSVVQYTDQGVQYVEHPVNRVLYAPNEYQTKYDFVGSIVTDLLQYGNAYIRIYRGNNQTITALVPLDPEQIEISSNQAGYPVYKFQSRDTLTARDVIHIKDIAGHDAKSLSRVELASEIVGPLKAANRLMSETFKHGVSVNYTVELDQSLDDSTRERLYESLKASYGRKGSQRGGIAVLEGGKMNAVKGSTPADMDIRELRMNLINEIAGVFRIPQNMVGSSGNITYNNVSAMRSGFYSDTLGPIVTNIEQALSKRLLREGLYVKFDVESIIKGDPASQMAYAVQGVQAGILTPNEGREYIGYNPIEGGDELAAPSAAPEAEPAPNEPDPESDDGNVGEDNVRDE